jgi:hypothetical protein
MDPFRVSYKVTVRIGWVRKQHKVTLYLVRLAGLDVDTLHHVQTLTVTRCTFQLLQDINNNSIMNQKYRMFLIVKAQVSCTSQLSAMVAVDGATACSFVLLYTSSQVYTLFF